MNAVQLAPPVVDLVPPPPPTPCVQPALLAALGDRQFVHDGSPKWSIERAEDVVDELGVVDLVLPTHAALTASMAPPLRQWLGDRLTVLWTMFAGNRSAVDSVALTVWLCESLRLLNDVPHDIVAHAIDTAIRTSRHGFVPSLGEIRAIADPLVTERRGLIERLSRMRDAAADPVAVEAREARRRERAARAEYDRRHST